MQDKVFIDSNILIYAYSIDEVNKKNIVENLLNKHELIVISIQTINEFINVMTKKKMLNYEQVDLVVNELFSTFTIEIISKVVIQKAIELAKKHSYSYFDSLIIASAQICNCTILYSEDMHHQHVIESNLIIINPFK